MVVKSRYRILMFTPAFAPFANPEAIVNSKLALAFLDRGWEVDVVSRSLAEESKYNYGSEWVEPWMPLQKVTHVVKYSTGGSLSRFAGALWSGIRMGHPVEGCRWAAGAYDVGMGLHKRNPYDVILSRSAHLPAMIMSRETGLPWIANWNDPSGDKNPPPYGKGAKERLGFLNERYLRDVSQHASWHTFPSERMRRYICGYLGSGSERKSSAIPHVALSQKTRGQRLGNSMFTVCHAGHISTHRNPETFLRGMAAFVQNTNLQTALKIVFIGLCDVNVQKLAEGFGLKENLHFAGPLGYFETLKKLAQSDVLLVMEADSPGGIYLPAKFVDYVQTSRPILAVSPKVSTLRDIISQYGGGIAADCLSSDDIGTALQEMYGHWKEGTLEEKLSSDRLYHLFAPEKVLAQYEQIFEATGVKSRENNRTIYA
jgi:glycosyltransferase involved in cell wall biosynthesis